jgi:hypothetical protein
LMRRVTIYTGMPIVTEFSLRSVKRKK